MSYNERTRLTLDERLALAAQSRASSPEAAAALVRKFSELPAAYVFCGSPDVEAMNELTGEFWEDPRVDVDSYRGFCPSFLVAMEYGNVSILPDDVDLCRPVYGTRINNALVLLGEMLLDQAVGRRKHKEVYHCLRMTLEQYLAVLAGPDFQRSGSEKEWFTAWQDTMLKENSADLPLAQALAGILRRYMAGWAAFDRLDHVLRCLAGLALHQEQAGTRYDISPCPDSDAAEGDASLLLKVSRTEDAEAFWHFRRLLRRCGIGRDPDELPRADQDCPNPRDYFLNLARDCAPNLPDPGSEMEARTLRSQLFLSDWQYGPAVLRKQAEQLPFPEFEPLLKECLDQDRLAGAMREINKAVIDLFMLWVEPYLWMKAA